MYYSFVLNKEDFFSKYFRAYDLFRQELAERPPSVISLEMHRAARVLGDTPLSAYFVDLVKGVDQGRYVPELDDAQRREFLKQHARNALLGCGSWHRQDQASP